MVQYSKNKILLCIHAWIEPQGEQFLYHPEIEVDEIMSLQQAWVGKDPQLKAEVKKNPLNLPRQIQDCQKDEIAYSYQDKAKWAYWVVQPAADIEAYGRHVNIVKIAFLPHQVNEIGKEMLWNWLEQAISHTQANLKAVQENLQSLEISDEFLQEYYIKETPISSLPATSTKQHSAKAKIAALVGGLVLCTLIGAGIGIGMGDKEKAAEKITQLKIKKPGTEVDGATPTQASNPTSTQVPGMTQQPISPDTAKLKQIERQQQPLIEETEEQPPIEEKALAELQAFVKTQPFEKWYQEDEDKLANFDQRCEPLVALDNPTTQELQEILKKLKAKSQACLKKKQAWDKRYEKLKKDVSNLAGLNSGYFYSKDSLQKYVEALKEDIVFLLNSENDVLPENTRRKKLEQWQSAWAKGKIKIRSKEKKLSSQPKENEEWQILSFVNPYKKIKPENKRIGWGEMTDTILIEHCWTLQIQSHNEMDYWSLEIQQNYEYLEDHKKIDRKTKQFLIASYIPCCLINLKEIFGLKEFELCFDLEVDKVVGKAMDIDQFLLLITLESPENP